MTQTDDGKQLSIAGVRRGFVQAIINFLIIISFPLVWLLEHMQRVISSRSEQVSVSREDISAMVSVATEEEVIEKEEKKRIKADQAALNKFLIKNKPDKMSEGDLMNLKAAMENLRMSSQHLLDMAQ